MRILTVIIIGLLFFGCQQSQDKGRALLPDPGFFKLIDQQIIPHNTRFSDAAIGGISGISNLGENRFYLISDDGSNINPARFFEVEFIYDRDNFERIVFHRLLYFRQEDNSFFPSLENADSIYVDPESIRYDSTGKQVIWTSEGYGENGIHPMILRHKTNGFFKSKNLLSPRYLVSDADGPRHNGSFEGLTLIPNSTQCWISMEYPLKQDGEPPSYQDHGAPVRLIRYDYAKNEILAEFAYPLEKVFADGLLGHGGGNGVVEILYHRENELLVMERSYVPGKGNYIRLFLANLSTATNILEIQSLQDKQVQVATKKLILDLNQLGLDHIDNIEGFDWGKKLLNGNASMIFVSDNNFNENQVNQFIAVERIKPF